MGCRTNESPPVSVRNKTIAVKQTVKIALRLIRYSECSSRAVHFQTTLLKASTKKEKNNQDIQQFLKECKDMIFEEKSVQ